MSPHPPVLVSLTPGDEDEVLQGWTSARRAWEAGCELPGMDPLERVLTPISGDSCGRVEESSSRAPSLPLPYWSESKVPQLADTSAGTSLSGWLVWRHSEPLPGPASLFPRQPLLRAFVCGSLRRSPLRGRPTVAGESGDLEVCRASLFSVSLADFMLQPGQEPLIRMLPEVLPALTS